MVRGFVVLLSKQQRDPARRTARPSALTLTRTTKTPASNRARRETKQYGNIGRQGRKGRRGTSLRNGRNGRGEGKHARKGPLPSMEARTPSRQRANPRAFDHLAYASSPRIFLSGQAVPQPGGQNKNPVGKLKRSPESSTPPSSKRKLRPVGDDCANPDLPPPVAFARYKSPQGTSPSR